MVRRSQLTGSSAFSLRGARRAVGMVMQGNGWGNTLQSALSPLRSFCTPMVTGEPAAASSGFHTSG